MSPHFGSLVTAVESQVKHLGLIFDSENVYKVFTIWSPYCHYFLFALFYLSLFLILCFAVCALKHVGSSVLYHCCIQ